MTVNESAKTVACAELESDLVLFHYGDLDGAERQRMEVHLRECFACAQSLSDLADLLPQTVLADEPLQHFGTAIAASCGINWPSWNRPNRGGASFSSRFDPGPSLPWRHRRWWHWR